MGKIELQPSALMPCKHRIFFADVNILGVHKTQVTAIVHLENLKDEKGIFVRFWRTMVDPSRISCCTNETVGKATIQILGGSNICGVLIGGTCFCSQAPEN